MIIASLYDDRYGFAEVGETKYAMKEAKQLKMDLKNNSV